MKKDYTHIAIVLDRSGSMASCADDTIGGFNTFIEEQKNGQGEASLTLCQFDTVYETVHDAIALKDVPPLKFEPRGSTALLDAIGRTINDTGAWLKGKPEEERPERVVFVILTDGHENASHEFTRPQIKEMIQRQEGSYKWQFVFLGANQDAIATGADMGIPMSSTLTYDTKNTRQAFHTVSASLSRTRASGASATMAFSDNDRKRNKPSR